MIKIEFKKVVGVGECGLDYYHLKDRDLDESETQKEISLQKENFRKILLKFSTNSFALC